MATNKTKIFITQTMAPGGRALLQEHSISLRKVAEL